MSIHSSAQEKRKLTPINVSPRIAYVDIDRLHRDYPALKAAREALMQQWQSAQNEFEQSKALQAERFRQQLRSESLQKGGKKTDIQQAGQQVVDSLVAAWELRKRSLVESRIKGAQAFEKNIAEAVRQVVRAGGFTEVKTIKSGEVPAPGTDITSLVLQKLH